MVGPSAKRAAYSHLHDMFKASERLICRTLGVFRSTIRYQSIRDDSEVENKLLSLSERYPTRGVDWYYGKIRQEGLPWNRKRVLRVYRNLGLKLRRKRRKRIIRPSNERLVQPIFPNETWSMDFMSDSLADGRRIRILNVIDDYNRQSLVIEAGISMPSERVIRSLEQAIEIYGKPRQIRTDNGPEFTSRNYEEWCERKNIKMLFIKPGKPSQNGYMERFNRTYREDVLDAYIIESLNELQNVSDSWREEYNSGHPHQALKRMSPITFAYSRRKVIDAYDKVKAKVNGDLQSPALTISPSSMPRQLSDYKMKYYI